jgi:hypothetical protein
MFEICLNEKVQRSFFADGSSNRVSVAHLVFRSWTRCICNDFGPGHSLEMRELGTAPHRTAKMKFSSAPAAEAGGSDSVCRRLPEDYTRMAGILLKNRSTVIVLPLSRFPK